MTSTAHRIQPLLLGWFVIIIIIMTTSSVVATAFLQRALLFSSPTKRSVARHLLHTSSCVTLSPPRLEQERRRSTTNPLRPSTARTAASSVVLGATTTTTTTTTTVLSRADEGFLRQALEHARHGVGHTFPNPAVGCVIVASYNNSNNNHNNNDENENSLAFPPRVIGAGFHPRAGYPHAEIFALLEAAGHVPDGVAAAHSVVQQKGHSSDDAVAVVVEQLTRQYIQDGVESLFSSNCLQPKAAAALTKEEDGVDPTAVSHVTAYVTLEPCCHTGKVTPPCTAALVAAGISRVVVGCRDPNPRVDGGGVQYLEQARITVDVATVGGPLQRDCADLITNFGRRITPPQPSYDAVNGAVRAALRSLAGRRKQDKSLREVSWGGPSVPADSENPQELVDALVLEPEWMEHVDDLLWREELVLLRLNAAVAKRRFCKQLGARIAGHLQAHVAQEIGHTVLLYRPGKPPKLNLVELVAEAKEN